MRWTATLCEHVKQGSTQYSPDEFCVVPTFCLPLQSLLSSATKLFTLSFDTLIVKPLMFSKSEIKTLFE